jgi:recombination protein RecA
VSGLDVLNKCSYRSRVALPAHELSSLLSDLRRTRALVKPQELAYRLPPTVPTGLEALDRLLGGGLPQGRIVELASSASGAATAVAFSILARVTGEGGLAAWVDRADALDPQAAAEAGARLPRLLWCRPEDQRAALRAADVLVASGAFPLVILDIFDPRPSQAGRPRASGQEAVRRFGEAGRGRPSREPDVTHGAWLRLSRGAEATRTCLLTLGGGGAGTFAAATLRLSRCKPCFEGMGPGRTFEGLSLTLALERNKLGLPPGEAPLRFEAPAHLPNPLRDPAPGAKGVLR